MRTLTLAGRLSHRGFRVGFMMRRFAGDLFERVAAAGFPVLDLGPAADGHGWLGVPLADEIAAARAALATCDAPPRWIVVDHYELDATWEAQVAAGSRVFAIDDLADRPHRCDALLDQNAQRPGRYDALIPVAARRFLGPPYALVRDEFATVRERARERDGTVRRVLVFYGGIDAGGETAKALRALRGVAGDFTIDAVAPDASPQRAAAVAAAAADPRVRLHARIDRMADQMERADLALGAAGTASWERCLVGLPTVATAVAPNQEPVLAALADAGAVIALGSAAQVDEAAIAGAVAQLAAEPARVRAIGAAARALCDGYARASAEVLDGFGDPR